MIEAKIYWEEAFVAYQQCGHRNKAEFYREELVDYSKDGTIPSYHTMYKHFRRFEALLPETNSAETEKSSEVEKNEALERDCLISPSERKGVKILLRRSAKPAVNISGSAGQKLQDFRLIKLTARECILYKRRPSPDWLRRPRARQCGLHLPEAAL